MSYVIPFHRDVFTPKTIHDNETSDAPTTFELSMAVGADQARLKSILWATGAIAGWLNGSEAWSPEMQASTIECFKTGPQLFINCVAAIANLSAPAALCRRVGISVPEKAKDGDAIPITNGTTFSRVAPYLPNLALEVAFAIQQLTAKGSVDGRFFEQPSGSAETPGNLNGSATSARPTNDGAATAASATRTASRRRSMSPPNG